jgi:hypothetical protein
MIRCRNFWKGFCSIFNIFGNSYEREFIFSKKEDKDLDFLMLQKDMDKVWEDFNKTFEDMNNVFNSIDKGLYNKEKK